MYLLNRNIRTALLFKDSNILIFPDKSALENCVFIKNFFDQILPTPSENRFTSLQIHMHIAQDGLIKVA